MCLFMSFSLRPDHHPVHPLHGWSRAARWPDCDYLPGKAVLLWLTSLPEIPPWIWLLSDCGKEGGTKYQHSQQHQYLHQHKHQHQQAARSQGLSLIILKNVYTRMLCRFAVTCILQMSIPKIANYNLKKWYFSVDLYLKKLSSITWMGW